jgi:hypothetical protein
VGTAAKRKGYQLSLVLYATSLELFGNSGLSVYITSQSALSDTTAGKTTKRHSENKFAAPF